MGKILVFLICLIYILFAGQVYADEGWVIEKFRSEIAIEKSGVVVITEKLDVDFLSLSKHGIYRDIPYIYEADGEKVYTEISVESVLQNNSPARYSVSRNDGYMRLKIGDSGRKITGKNNYQINYKARGVLRGFDAYDELYWNVTGNNWPVVIMSAEAEVALPGDGITNAKCFAGYAGSQDECEYRIAQTGVISYSSSRALPVNHGMTIVTGYNKGLAAIVKVDPPISMWDKFRTWYSITVLIISLFSGMGVMVYLWNKHGRDYWFKSDLFGIREDMGEVKPIGARETEVVEFVPPESLRPAEIGVLADEIAHTHDITATIIDLAGRGYIHITEIAKKWIFGKLDFELARTSKDDSGLLPYERKLLEKLFVSKNSVLISGLKTTFYEQLREIKKELYKDMTLKKFFPDNPEKVRIKYLIYGMVIAGIGIFLLYSGFFLENIIVVNLSIGVILGGLILIILSRYMPRRTAYGRDLYRRIRGYRMFISKAEKYRQRFFEEKNLLNEVLPYAIVFGLTDKFAKSMKDMGVEASNPGWYTGTSSFKTHTFISSLGSFSNNMSSAIAASPKSSGFSGGGSSGGGFGGGGGGSW